jgi:hypothetical protein
MNSKPEEPTLRIQVDQKNHAWSSGWHDSPIEDWAELVESLRSLSQLAKDKKSVCILAPGWTGYRGYIPASRAINFTGDTLLRLFEGKKICIYRPKKTKQQPKQSGEADAESCSAVSEGETQGS